MCPLFKNNFSFVIRYYHTIISNSETTKTIFKKGKKLKPIFLLISNRCFYMHQNFYVNTTHSYIF